MGQSEGATAELGELVLNSRGGQLARAIKNVKVDVVTKQLQEEFFQRSGMPLNTLWSFYENYIICGIGIFLVLTDGGTRNG